MLANSFLPPPRKRRRDTLKKHPKRHGLLLLRALSMAGKASIHACTSRKTRTFIFTSIKNGGCGGAPRFLAKTLAENEERDASPLNLSRRWAHCITIRQPASDKQQLPQSTDNESKAITHG